MQYSGIYRDGSDSVILRFSETKNLHEESSGLLPSLSLKFLRDGQISENIVAMPNFTGTDSWNFFELPMKSRVEPFDPEVNACEVVTIQRKLVDASEWPFACGISTIGDRNSDGSNIAENDVNVPFELQFTSAF